MIENETNQLAIINPKEQTKKIVILAVLTIVVVILLILVAKNANEIIKQERIYRQYEAQIIALAKQEQDKQMEIEKSKQERLPKLTRRRKK